MSKKLDDYHAREALDRAFMLAEMVDTYLVEHPYIVADTRMLRLAIDASMALAQIYLVIGEKHL